MFTLKHTSKGEKKKNKSATDEIIHLTGDIDEDTAESVCRDILKLVSAGKVKQIQLVINSGGGNVYDGFAIIDVMQWSPIPVHTVAYGLVASMALEIFITGSKGHRVVLPNAWLMAHQFWSIKAGRYGKLVMERNHEDLLHKKLVEHTYRHTALKSRKSVEKELFADHDRWITPEEAVVMGLADRIYRQE